MAEKLTPQQQMAVDDRGGKLLVSAAAGSGKTKVLVDRLLKYIRDPIDPANIDDFLIITYTKAAASELRSKIAAKLSEHIADDPGNRHLQRQLQRLYLTKISTVHSFCSDILREYAYQLDISGDFRVADENEIVQLRSRAMEQVLETAYASIGEDADLQAFVDTQGLGRNDALVPEIIQGVYDSAMCHTDPQKWCDKCIADAKAEAVSDPVQTPWGRYLMDDLFACLDDQIGAMSRCADVVAAIEGLEKPAALLCDTVYQLRHLRQSETWDDVVSRKNIHYGRLTFPKKFDVPEVTERVKAVRGACKELVEEKTKVFSNAAADVLEDLEQSAAAARGLMHLVTLFGENFARAKRMRRVLDFSDLEHKTLDLLLGKSRSGPTAAAKEIGERFREIMVDEYQDSNGVQDAIFSALTQKKQNLFMVGDVKQSIYQFRLADPEIFIEKYNRYADAEQAEMGEGRKVLLSSNFRSGGGVIEGANHVFAACMTEVVGGIDYGEDEALREGVPHIPLYEPEVELHGIRVNEDTYAEEAAFVADRICQLTDGKHYVRQGEELRPITVDDVVILLRSPGSVGMDFVMALEQRGIRCTTGSGTDLLLTPEIQTFRALLQVISNPRQDIPLLAVLASPVFGFSADDLAAIRSENRNCCFYDALVEGTHQKAVSFLEVLDDLRSAAVMGTLAELLGKIFHLTRIDTVYSVMENSGNACENLQSFYQLAVDFSGMGGGDLDRFLAHLDALEDRGLAGAANESAAGCVTIMSIHKSKGLEFPVVFLCGLSKRFNQESLRQPVLCHKDMGLGLSCVDQKNRVRYPTISKAAIAAKMEADSLSEEMRVLYVAMTRARDRLIMTYASQSLDKEIADIALRMDISGKIPMTRNVSCPGKWVLYSALQRTEAGEFFAIGGKPEQTVSCNSPWKIRVCDGFVLDADLHQMEQSNKVRTSEDALLQIRQQLQFRYAHEAATAAPSKQTATGRKGRVKDQEALEQAAEPKHIYRTWRKPEFAARSQGGTAYGSAVHCALQYIRYDACADTEGVRQEISRLVEEQFLTEEQAAMIDCNSIAKFFQTPIGCRLRESKDVLREFKFSILDDAAQYGDGLTGEKVLLQGVVDCALLEPDGITVVDFKTDYVTDDTIDMTTERYRPQVEAYADALRRIFNLPVKEKALYNFHIGNFRWL